MEAILIVSGLVCENGCGRIKEKSLYYDWNIPVDFRDYRRIEQRPLKVIFSMWAGAPRANKDAGGFLE